MICPNVSWSEIIDPYLYETMGRRSMALSVFFFVRPGIALHENDNMAIIIGIDRYGFLKCGIPKL